MSRMGTILGLVGFLAILGCGSGGGGGPSTSGNGSCATLSSGTVVTCTDFGSGFTASEAMQACPAGSTAMYSTAPCPSANRVGRCEITDSASGASAGETINFYPPETAASAMMACTSQNGTSGVTTTWVAN